MPLRKFDGKKSTHQLAMVQLMLSYYASGDMDMFWDNWEDADLSGAWLTHNGCPEGIVRDFMNAFLPKGQATNKKAVTAWLNEHESIIQNWSLLKVMSSDRHMPKEAHEIDG